MDAMEVAADMLGNYGVINRKPRIAIVFAMGWHGMSLALAVTGVCQEVGRGMKESGYGW